ncbi:MAG: helix-turn-helix domain-containing protein [Parasphingorhabdus sp.]
MTRKHRSPCPIARTLDIIGDKWTLLVLRDALIFDRKSFAEFEQSGEKIPTNILAERLKRLVEFQFLEKVPYQEKPVRYHYLPTDKGEAVRPVIRAMKNFGDTYLEC